MEKKSKSKVESMIGSTELGNIGDFIRGSMHISNMGRLKEVKPFNRRN